MIEERVAAIVVSFTVFWYGSVLISCGIIALKEVCNFIKFAGRAMAMSCKIFSFKYAAGLMGTTSGRRMRRRWW